MVRQEMEGPYQIIEVFASEKRADRKTGWGARLRFQYNRVEVYRVIPDVEALDTRREKIWASWEFPAKWKTPGSKGGRAWDSARVIVSQLLGEKITEKNLPPAQGSQLHLPSTGGRRLVVMAPGGGEEE